MNLYHYCATWFVDGVVNHAAGVMKSPYAIGFDNYGDFLKAIQREIDQPTFTITSLSFLGTEV